MFRGSKTSRRRSSWTRSTITGGDFDADTENEITQYFFTCPRSISTSRCAWNGRARPDCSTSQSLWDKERGAITQEVTQDNSNARLPSLRQDEDRTASPERPYAKNGLGTVHDFPERKQPAVAQAFYGTWYHPNNAIYVIVGDVDRPRRSPRSGRFSADLPPGDAPGARPGAPRTAQTPRVYHDNSSIPVTVVLLGYRMPGYDSPDYAASRDSQRRAEEPARGPLRLSRRGQVHPGRFAGASRIPRRRCGIGYNVVPVTTKPEDADAAMSMR